MDEILDLIETTEYDTSECRYILHDGIGYKIYDNTSDRDYAFLKQLKAFRHNLAPEPYKRINIDMYPAYTTEHCGPTLYQLGMSDDVFKDCIRELKKIGLIMYDDHGNNFCFKNGNVVCIDFGKYSFDPKYA